MSSSSNNFELKIPEGINYECSGCGICCSGWTVPMTKADYERISPVDWGDLKSDYKGKVLFREMSGHEKKGTPYDFKIVSETGTCPFLVDNLCFIHGQKGHDFKPAMCQLFPYMFNETPSGIYSSVSFVSMAVIHNTGKSLLEQRDYLDRKLADFRKHHADYKPDWSKIQLAAGTPMSWSDYLNIEEEMFFLLKDVSQPIMERLKAISLLLSKKVREKIAEKSGTAVPDTPLIGADSLSELALNKLDRHLLASFHKVYFSPHPLKQGENTFNALTFTNRVLFNQSTVLEFPGDYFAFDQLKEIAWPEGNNDQANDLIYRYVYSHIFGKKYFGGGFAYLSLITGYHHLVLMICLMRLQAKGLAKIRGSKTVEFGDVVAAVKRLETMVGEIVIGGWGAGAMELLLQSTRRAQRFIANA